MVDATCSGRSPYPSSRSPFTGTELASAICRIRSNITSLDTDGAPSGRLWSPTPREKAIPALVVAIAENPASASRTALPASQAFGITKDPSCSSRKVVIPPS